MDLNSRNRLYTVWGAGLVLALMAFWSGHLRDKVAQADGQVKILKQQAALFEKEALQLNKALEAANFRYEALKRDSDAKVDRARRTPIPTPAPAPPETVEELTVSLRALLSPTVLVVSDPNAASLLNQPDGERVFLAFEEARRIPGFEIKVKAQDEAIVSLEATIEAASVRFQSSKEALALAGTRLENTENQNKVIMKEVKQAKMQGRLQKILWGAAGIGVGFLLGGR